MLFDVGANLDARVLDVAVAIDLAAALEESVTRTIIVVPTTTDRETIDVALRTVRRAEIARPDALVAPMVRTDGSDTKLARRILEDAGGKGGLILVHPRLMPRALEALNVAAISPWR